MKCLTRHNGKVLRSGDPADVDASTAQRWLSNGIATTIESDEFVVDDEMQGSGEDDLGEVAESKQEFEEEPANDEEEPEVELKAISSMSAKELYEECIARGIEVEPRKSKQSYLKLLAE